MENNTFYVLSKKYKKVCKMSKKKESLCIECKMNSVTYFDGCWKGWCASCKEIDDGLYEWQMACMEESSKPKKEQNMSVFLGRFK